MANFRRKSRGRFSCVDCSQDLRKLCEPYEAIPSTAADAKLAKIDVNICVGCLEGRLGRKLRPEDFTEDDINTSPLILRSHRLIDRQSWIKEYW